MAKKKTEKSDKEKMQEKRAGLEDAMATIRKDYKVDIDRFADIPFGNFPAISSGVLSIDRALKAFGFPRGRITELHGPEASGKSTIALLMAAEAQKAGGIVAWFDLENAFDREFAAFLGVNLKELIFVDNASAEDAFSAMLVLIQKHVDLIVVDSVANLVPKVELEGGMDDQQIALQARIINKGLRKMTAIIASFGTAVVFINQLRTKIGVRYGPPEDTTGGKGLKFYASVRMNIYTKKESRIIVNKEIIGHKGFVQVVKNRLGAPYGRGEYTLIYGIGIDRVVDVCTVAKEEGIIESSGSWVSYTSLKHKNADGGDLFKIQGIDNFIQNIRRREDVVLEIRERTIEKIMENEANKRDAYLQQPSCFEIVDEIAQETDEVPEE